MVRLKVKEIAKQKGLSQARLSRRADVDLTTLRKIYQFPTTTNVTIETLDRLAKALGVDITDLIESIPDDEQRSNGERPSSQDDEREDGEG